jgi:hypothetical protein
MNDKHYEKQMNKKDLSLKIFSTNLINLTVLGLKEKLSTKLIATPLF